MSTAGSIGNYDLVAELRRGGMGIVYAARHRTMGQRAVIKKLLPELGTNRDLVERFFQEAVAAAALDDPGIVRIFDQGVLADGSAYIVMEHLQGESLADRIARKGRLPREQAATFLRHAARAVGKAHVQRIIHRDLKPDNLYIVSDPDLPGGERVKVLDFGIAKLSDTSRVRTLTNMPMGTPGYMSPEQWTSASHVDARTDIYALGVILFEMLTGRLPFTGPGIAEFLDQHRYARIPLPSETDRSLSAFDGMILRALSKRAESRFGSLEEMVLALPLSRAATSSASPALHGGQEEQTAPNMFERFPLTHSASSRRRIAVVAAAVAALGLSPVFFAGTVQDDEAFELTPVAAPPPAPYAQKDEPARLGAADAGASIDAGMGADGILARPLEASSATPASPSLATVRRKPPARKLTKPQCPGPNSKACEPTPEEPGAAERVAEHLSVADIRAGLGAMKARIRACEATPEVHGLVRLSMRVAPSGMVETAFVLQTPDFKLGECVLAAVRKAVFSKTKTGGSFVYPVRM